MLSKVYVGFILTLLLSAGVRVGAFGQCRDTVSSWLFAPADTNRKIDLSSVEYDATTYDLLAEAVAGGQYRGAILTSFNASNQPLLSKEYQHSDYSINFLKAKMLSNGNRLVLGFLGGAAGGGNNDISVTCLLPNGSVLWHKRINLKLLQLSVAPDIFGMSVTENADGSACILFNSRFNVTGYTHNLSSIIKLNVGSGQIIWQKTYYAPFGNTYDIVFSDIGTINNNIVVYGSFLNDAFPRESGRCAGTGLVLMQLNTSNGTLHHYRAFCYDTIYRQPLEGYGNRNNYLPGMYYQNTISTHLVRFGSQVSLSNITRLSPAFVKLNVYKSIDSIKITQLGADTGLFSFNVFSGAAVNRNNDLLTTGLRYYNNTQSRYKGFFSQSSANRFESKFDLIYPPLTNELVNFNRVVYLTAPQQAKLIYQNSTRQIVVYDGDNELSISDTCSRQQSIQETSIKPLLYNEIAVPIVSNDTMVFEKYPGTITVSDFPMVSNRVCQSISICDSLSIIQPAAAYCVGEAYTFSARKSQQCKRSINWTIDTTAMSMLYTTDTTLTVRFKKAGQGYIKLALLNCSLADSVLVTAHTAAPAVNLGKDVTLCSGKDLKLSPTAFYKSYLWSNGSQDSFIVVNQPGRYTLQVWDSCNTVYTDTLFVRSPTLSLYAGADQTICKGDSVYLSALAGFTAYQWLPVSTLAFANQYATAALPISSTSYTVTAVDKDDCVFKDTVKVMVQDCPTSIYFPTAFTPNNDGHNDTYKPIVTGPVKFFTFLIFNRYGQKVFETRQPNAGWDGKLNNQLQGAASFVWYCEYKFRNQPLKKEKGSFLLIK